MYVPQKPEMSNLELQSVVSCLTGLLVLNFIRNHWATPLAPWRMVFISTASLTFLEERIKACIWKCSSSTFLLLQAIYTVYETFEIIFLILCLISSCVVHVLDCINLHLFTFQSGYLSIANAFIWVIPVLLSLQQSTGSIIVPMSLRAEERKGHPDFDLYTEPSFSLIYSKCSKS